MAKKLDKTDVVIVGSGWSGGIVAAELSKKGYNVVILEKGKQQQREDFMDIKDELKFSLRYDMMQNLKRETVTARGKRDQTAVPVRNNLSARIGEGTGGAGVHWNGITFRWLPYDLEIYSQTVQKYGKDIIPEDCTIQDWGVTYDEMEPYFDKFEQTLGISGEENPLGAKRSNPYPTPPLKSTAAIDLFTKATKDLGYHPYRIPAATLSEKWTNPDGETINACVYCAFCEEYGCHFGAKADPLTTVLATAIKTGKTEIRNGCMVTGIEHDGKKAKGLKYVDIETGEEFIQEADVVVLAGFVFTNNKLLLMEGIGEPYDPEKNTGVIGRNFTGHFEPLSTRVGATGFFNDKKFNLAMGTGSMGATIDDFTGNNIDHSELDFLHGYEIHIFQLGSRPIKSNAVPSGTAAYGKEFKDTSIKYANSNLFITAQTAFLPNRYSYLDLDPKYKDEFGNPLVRATIEFTKQDIERTRHGMEKCEEIMTEMGADIVEVSEIKDDTEFDNKFFTDHFIGGVIMGDDTKTSAVNTYSQMWDMDNLFVVGGSSLPHTSAYNPTGTIGAFAYRAAEGIEKHLKDGGLVEKPKN